MGQPNMRLILLVLSAVVIQLSTAEPGPWAGKEAKHVPQVLCYPAGINSPALITVTVPHGMDDTHYITHFWAEADPIRGKPGMKIFSAYKLSPSDHANPQINIDLPEGTKRATVYAACNLHGIWKTDVGLSETRAKEEL